MPALSRAKGFRVIPGNRVPALSRTKGFRVIPGKECLLYPELRGSE